MGKGCPLDSRCGTTPGRGPGIQAQTGWRKNPIYGDRVNFSSIVYVIRTGSIWNALPREKFGGLGSSALHEWFQAWAKVGLFAVMWRMGLAEYDELEGIAWKWQSADGTMQKAPLALESVGRNPTDRGKMGSKRHALVDGRGVPLSLLVTGANVPECTQLAALLENKVVAQSQKGKKEENLYLDAGYRGKGAAAEGYEYRPHIRSRKEERAGTRARSSGCKARRWVVEASHSWFNRFRKLVPRYEKTALSFVGLLHLAAALIILNKVMTIYG